MRALLQRVTSARVEIDGGRVGAIGPGLLALLGVGGSDTAETARRMWEKVAGLRIFADADGRTNLSLADVGGSVLVVSQFTLYASCRHGRRPSFTEAGAPGPSRELYERFCACARDDLGPERVQTGVFGADMQVSLVNDGPFTIWLDSAELGIA